MDALDRQFKAIDEHNARVYEGMKRDKEHEIKEVVKDAVKFDFRKMQFYHGGFGDGPKPTLSTRLWRFQVYLEKTYPFIKKLFSFFRRIKYKTRKIHKAKGGYYL